MECWQVALKRGINKEQLVLGSGRGRSGAVPVLATGWQRQCRTVSENAVKVLNMREEGKSVSVCCQMTMLSLSFLVVYKFLKNPFL